MNRVILRNQTLYFEGILDHTTAGDLYSDARKALEQVPGKELFLDTEGVHAIDNAGAAFLDHLEHLAAQKGVSVRFQNTGEPVQTAMATFSSRSLPEPRAVPAPALLERTGGFFYDLRSKVVQALVLVADAFSFSMTGLVRRQGIRKGEFVQQCILIGMNALPIVALISFLIGFILALQSAAQLRMFGASIYVADLIVISMTREMGPLMTAIIFAGRSGSAIASEIATMVVTEETDALKSMALNPIRYMLVPKIYAITLTQPLLTILSVVIGIAGGLAISVTYLNTGILPFYHEAVNALALKDVLTGLVKSVVFAWLIVMVGAYYGFNVQGGSGGVGRATTSAVVASVFMVVLADSLLGLLFYFGSIAP